MLSEFLMPFYRSSVYITWLTALDIVENEMAFRECCFFQEEALCERTLFFF